MNINWVLCDQIFLPPNIDIQKLKNIGSLWGSWKTWRSCLTDNVICHDPEQAKQLIQADFASKCNFYIPQTLYQTLEDKQNLQAYAGEFAHQVTNQEEIVAMHLASTVSDVVLLLGFDWSKSSNNQKHYLGMIYHVIQSTPKIQWVMIDPPSSVPSEFTKLDNFSTDSLSSVFELLSN